MFKQSPFSFEELDVRDSTDGRFYYRKGSIIAYPSVTTVLGRIKKDGLENWRKAVGKEKADIITKKAADRGSRLHNACEKFVLNESPLFLPNSKTEQLFNQLSPVLEKNINTVYNTEFCLFSDRLRTAGRCDLFCEWNSEPVVVDYKTSTKEKKLQYIKNYLIQATAYSMMIGERINIPIKKFIILIACEETQQPQIFTGNVKDYYEETFHLFRGDLNIWY